MTTLIGALLCTGWACWAVRRLAAWLHRCPWAARLFGPAAAREAAERRAAHRLLTREIDPAGYRSAMHALTDRRAA